MNNKVARGAGSIRRPSSERRIIPLPPFLCLSVILSGSALVNAQQSDISSDEVVVFYPTSAYLDEAGKNWNVPIRGIIYEPEGDSRTRQKILDMLRESLGVADGSAEANRLEQRLSPFLVDNERGERISVQVGGKPQAAGVSEPNGHFRRTLQFTAEQMEQLAEPRDSQRHLDFEAVTRRSDRRTFSGRVLVNGRRGLSVISDIDDTIKVSGVGDHRAVLVNTFLKEFQAVPGMPRLYQALTDKGAAFHYVTGSPWQLYLPLAEFLRAADLPAGTFDMQHFRLKDGSALGLLLSKQETKLAAIGLILQAYPGRRFLLIGDSGEQDPEVYAKVAAKHSEQVAAVFIRNVNNQRAAAARFDALRRKLGANFRLFSDPAELHPVLDSLELP